MTDKTAIESNVKTLEASRPEIMGAPDSHQTMRAEFAKLKPCKILDASCGQGVLTQYLKELGWDVHAADIHADNFQIENVPFTAADLNEPLPFEDNSFDAVVFSNAIHRLWNVSGLIQEFHRILRTGGTLYINANNFADIATRIHYLLYGSIEYRPPGEGLDLVPAARVRINLSYLQIANHLVAAGFEIDRVLPASVRKIHRLLAPVTWLVRLVTVLMSEEKRKMNYLDVASSRAVLGGGYYMFIVAKKTEAGSDSGA